MYLMMMVMFPQSGLVTSVPFIAAAADRADVKLLQKYETHLECNIKQSTTDTLHLNENNKHKCTCTRIRLINIAFKLVGRNYTLEGNVLFYNPI